MFLHVHRQYDTTVITIKGNEDSYKLHHAVDHNAVKGLAITQQQQWTTAKPLNHHTMCNSGPPSFSIHLCIHRCK